MLTYLNNLTYKDIENDQYIQDFFRTRDLKLSTKQVYLKKIFEYCSFTGKTPTELINEAEKEEVERIKMKDRKLKNNYSIF